MGYASFVTWNSSITLGNVWKSLGIAEKLSVIFKLKFLFYKYCVTRPLSDYFAHFNVPCSRGKSYFDMDRAIDPGIWKANQSDRPGRRRD